MFIIGVLFCFVMVVFVVVVGFLVGVDCYGWCVVVVVGWNGEVGVVVGVYCYCVGCVVGVGGVFCVVDDVVVGVSGQVGGEVVCLGIVVVVQCDEVDVVVVECDLVVVFVYDLVLLGLVGGCVVEGYYVGQWCLVVCEVLDYVDLWYVVVVGVGIWVVGVGVVEFEV